MVEYITGMDTRIGYPNEHIAGDSDEEIASPLYATAVGLVMDGLKRVERKNLENESSKVSFEKETTSEEATELESEPVATTKKERKSFLDKLTERVKEFLDNAE